MSVSLPETRALCPAPAECIDGAPAQRAGLARFGAMLRSKESLALLDQAVASGTRFAVTVMIGRLCGKDELGVYTLGFSFVVVLAALQEALFTMPYTMQSRHLERDRRADFAGSVLMLCIALALGLAAVLGLLAGGTAFSAARGWLPAELPAVVGVLAGSILFTQLWEMARRMSFAHLRMGLALVVDLVVAAVQLGAMAMLALAGRLSAVTAYMALAVACLTAAVAWWLAFRGNVHFNRQALAPALAQSWRLGRWLACAQVASVAGAYVTHWLLAVVLGNAAAVGEYAAAMQLVLLSNPLILGFSNFLAPKMAHALATGGLERMRQVGRQATWLLGLAMAVFSLGVVAFGQPVVALVFSRDYEASRHLLAVLATGVSIAALVMGAGNALLAIGRSDLRLYGRLLALAVSLVGGCVLIRWLGVLGAAYSLLLGTLADTLYTWCVYRQAMRTADGSTT